MRFTSTKNELVLNKAPPNSSSRLAYFRREWYRKWNRIGATIACTLIFLFIIGVVMDSIWKRRDEEDYMCGGQKSADAGLHLITAGNCQLDGSCSVACVGIDFAENKIADFLRSEDLAKVCSGGKINLSISSSLYSPMRPGWIGSENIRLETLTIESGSIGVIEKGAFDGPQFRFLHTGRISNNEIDGIENGSFNLGAVNDFSFNDNTIGFVEEGVGAGLAKVVIFQFLRTTEDGQQLYNITGGGSYMPGMIIADFEFNTLDVLKAGMFNGLVQVQSLVLRQSKIRTIEEGAFEKCTHLELIDISGNQLSTFPAESFSLTNLRNTKLKYGLSTNGWVCDCSLEWLRKVWSFQSYENPADQAPPYCSGPGALTGKSFQDIDDFCSNVETTLMSSTTSEMKSTTTTREFTTTTLTTQLTKETSLSVNTTTSTASTLITDSTSPSPPPETLTMMCAGQRRFRTLPYARHPIELTDEIHFNVVEDSDGIVTVTLRDESPSSLNLTLMWLNNARNFEANTTTHIITDDPHQTGCIKDILPETTLPALLPDNLYTVCILPVDTSTISPFACRALKLRPTPPNRSWILQRDKTWILAVTALTLFLAAIFGALLGYLLVRRNPSLLRGSKRVVLINHQKADAIVMPKRYKSRQKAPTPRPQLIRSVSDSSAMSFGSRRSQRSGHSSGGSYVAPVEPTPLQLLAWRLDRMRERWKDDVTLRQDTRPPPLPPHPFRDRGSQPIFNYTVDVDSVFSHRTV